MLKLKPPAAVRLYGILISAAGLALMAVSYTWDVIRGDRIPHFGASQLAGCLVGAAMLAAGGWLFTAERPFERLLRRPRAIRLGVWRWAAALALAVPATALAMLLPRAKLFATANWLFWAYVLAVCLLLPGRLGRTVFLASASLGVFLTAISIVKVSLTGLPLTMLDVKIAVTDPAGLWDALHFPAWTRYAAFVAAAVVALRIISTALTATLRILGPGSTRHDWSRAAQRTGGIALICALAVLYFSHLFSELNAYRNTWDLEGVRAMAAEIGMLPYLAFSKRIEDVETGDFFRSSAGAQPPSSAQIRESVLRFVEFGATSAGSSTLLPNIVIVLAESTFDPNAAFRLTGTVESRLFSAGANTAAVGALRVNVIGGGTWVTEFETITGLDSRLFGYAGFYAHASLAPYVSRSLATHLKSKGYRTTALFPHDGDFYNYRRAYAAYGFDEISDSRDRGRSDAWRATDVQVIEDFERVMGANPKSPFLSYVLLIENHGPHECDVTSVDDMPVRLADTREFAPNCALHEYLRRLRSTEAAVSSVLDYLRKLERNDGRPYVLLVFGDHQPYTFTGTHAARYDFDPFRTAAGKTRTFFHLSTSVGNRLKCCAGDVPATLLPTLVSALAAQDPDDVYLGMNLWLYERCGSNATGGRPSEELAQRSADLDATSDSALVPTVDRSQTCRQAYEQALAGFRKAGIVSFRPEA